MIIPLTDEEVMQAHRAIERGGEVVILGERARVGSIMVSYDAVVVNIEFDNGDIGMGRIDQSKYRLVEVERETKEQNLYV